LPRENASLEARLNATNQALQPNAGGVIEYWSNAIAGEIRDDQGICVHNPDTDVFMKYHLAGAYDSNIALLLTTGKDRLHSYRRMAEVLRRTALRGKDLATNLQFHYGLVNWFLGQNIHARPTTRFVVPYLTAVGQLKEASSNIDLTFCFNQIRHKYLAHDDAAATAAYSNALDRKYGLLLRPLEVFFKEPHLLSGWLSINRNHMILNGNKVTWLKNPIELLADTYHFLNMDYVATEPAAYMIWSNDNKLLQGAVDFYRELNTRLGITEFRELDQAIQSATSNKLRKSEWKKVQAAHAGFQCGTEILNLLPFLAVSTKFYKLHVNEDLSINIPDELTSTDLQKSMSKVLAPPPIARSGEILADSGGMFYSREAPDMAPFIDQGTHFNEGDPLYIIEVMKMFNKVYAPFAGTVVEKLIEADGVIIKKGQPLFLVSPDEQVEEVSAETTRAIRQQHTKAFLATLS
jgi:biotin carboxyl carrier protein